MKDFWESRYGEAELAYGRKPNAFFAESLREMKAGKLLLPAEGQGRNAVWAAKQGWKVEAFDYAAAGRERALELAENEGVEIDFEQADASQYMPKNSPFDAIALIFAHFPPEIRQTFHPKIAEWLKPGGKVIFEAYHKTQLGRNSGGPKALPMLFSEEELRDEFPGLEFEVLEKVSTHLDEGTYHQGEAMVLRMIASKPL